MVLYLHFIKHPCQCVKSKFQYVHVGTLLIYDLEVRTFGYLRL